MAINRRNIGKHEMIGLNLAVTEKGREIARGMVVDETKNSFSVRSGDRVKSVLKAGRTFVFDVDGGVEVDGDDILFRPEDRLKKVRM